MFGNLKELPKPVGEYLVGMIHMDFIDQSRSQVFSFEEENAPRIIPVTIFYPADSSEGKKTAPYAFSEALEKLSKMTYGFWSRKMVNVKTHVYENISVSSKKDNFQIIFFNQGFISYEMQSTVLCSDLASLGYVVISVGHPYESSGVKYIDGKIVKVHDSFIQMQKKAFHKEYIKKIMKLLRDKNDYSDAQAMEVAEFLYSDNDFNDSVKRWADDTIFVADQLAGINSGKIESIFKNKLQLDRGFGITGHSLGGATSAQVCYVDERFICGINIDGGTWGDYLYKDIKTPFMVIGANLMRNTARTTFIYNSQDSYLIVVDRTGHWGYCDVLFVSRQAILMGNKIGLREKYEFREIITKFHEDFFAKYLLGISNINLNKFAFQGIDYKEKIDGRGKR